MKVKSLRDAVTIGYSSLPVNQLRRLSSSTGGFECLTALCSLLLSLGGDSVHVHDTLLGESLAHGDGGAFGRVELGGSDEACFLKLHEAETDVLTGSSSLVLWLGSVSCSVTVVLAETVDTDLLAHVHLVGDGSSTDIEPVVVVWGEFLLASGLDDLGPLLSIIQLDLKLDTKQRTRVCEVGCQIDYLRLAS